MLITIVASALFIMAPPPKDMRKEVDPPIGLWKLESLTIDGKAAEWKAADMHYRFVDHTLVLVWMGLEPVKQPVKCFKVGDQFEIDTGVASGNGGYMKGIFKIEGETLTICETTKPGGERPKRFESTADSRTSLWKLTKVK